MTQKTLRQRYLELTRPMTPDIREKAKDMVRGFLLLNKQDYLLGTDWHRDLAENISQALLEAHKAGREDAAKVVDGIAEEARYLREVIASMPPDAPELMELNDRLEELSGTQNERCLRSIASAIRSLP